MIDIDKHDQKCITVVGAFENNLKNCDVKIPKEQITIVTGVSGSGKSSLVFDTILSSSQRNFFYTLSHYFRQFLNLGSRSKVRFISGLSPCISLAQNETLPSIRTTVGSLTDINELLGVLFSSSLSTKLCPKHNIEVKGLDTTTIMQYVIDSLKKTKLPAAISFSVVEKKKGSYKSKLDAYYNKGFIRGYIDGNIYTLDNPPELDKEYKHTIKIITDIVNEKTSLKRLESSIELALEEGDGFLECLYLDNLVVVDIKHFSNKSGCPECGFSWPKLNSRYFSNNSLGKCPYCKGLGFKPTSSSSIDIEEEGSVNDIDKDTILELEDIECPHCKGTGLNQQLEYIKINNHSILDLEHLSIMELKDFLDSIYKNYTTTSTSIDSYNTELFTKIYEELCKYINKILELKLEYLSLSRRIWSLSRGELQRLKLSSILIENLRGIIYILDEPSQGLHPSEIHILCHALEELKKKKNTIILVDHDEMLMRYSDNIIDLGPSGGAGGGKILATFTPTTADLYKDISLTAKYLSNSSSLLLNESNKDKDINTNNNRSKEFISIKNPNYHNLKMKEFHFLKHGLNVITGVSGAGKSSSMYLFYKNIKNYLSSSNKSKFSFNLCSIEGIEDIKKVELIDKKMITKSSISMPATYLDIFTDIRNIYAQLPASQISGWTALSFSLMKDNGRCEECKGRGEVTLKMKFLADSKVVCPVCNGKRYKPFLLDIKYNTLSISDVLNLTIEEAYEHFSNFRNIQKKLKPAIDLGLGYLKLGQPSSSLSGGEAQRLKIVPYFSKQYNNESCIILDEPSSGLHFDDIKKLLYCLKNLKDKGTTIIIIEHNQDIIKNADWIVDIGPGSSIHGGDLVYEGNLEGLINNDKSITAKYLTI